MDEEIYTKKVVFAVVARRLPFWRLNYRTFSKFSMSAIVHMLYKVLYFKNVSVGKLNPTTTYKVLFAKGNATKIRIC